MKKTAIFLLISLLAFATLTGCGNNENTTDAPSSTPTVAPSPTDEPTSTPEPSPTDAPTATPEPSPTDEPTTEGSIEALPTETPTPIPTEPPHEHNYTEVESSEVAATCTTDGKKVDMICECGDKVEGEVVKATGHAYGEYKSDSNATYDADGTKTAECSVCGEKDTVTDAGSKLERPKYTYTDMNKTMYAKSSVNVRDLPSTDGNKLGGLSSGQTVTVTGKCNETGWYRIDYNGSVAYVSNSYLVDNKPAEPKPEEPSKPNNSEECPYPLYQPVDNWTSISWYYVNTDEGVFDSNAIVNTLCERHSVNYCDITVKWTGYFYNGGEVAYMTVSVP